jgi:hypothetical protein
LLKAQADNRPVIGGGVLLVPFFWQQVNGRLQKLMTVEGKERGWKKGNSARSKRYQILNSGTLFTIRDFDTISHPKTEVFVEVVDALNVQHLVK